MPISDEVKSSGMVLYDFGLLRGSVGDVSERAAAIRLARTSRRFDHNPRVREPSE